MKPEFALAVWSWEGGVDWAIRATALLAVAAMVAYGLRNRSAAARHLVWSVALAGALFLPLLQGSLPRWSVPLPATDVPPDAEQPRWLAYDPTADAPSNVGADASAPAELATVDRRPGASAAGPIAYTERSARVPLSVLASWTWTAGTAGMLAAILLGMLSLAVLRRSSKPLPAELADELYALQRVLGIRRPVDGRITSRRAIPLTWGWMRPVVLLPSETVDWPHPRREMVMLHELAHIKRCDFGVQLLGQLSRAVHWFNPLAWWALSRLRTEQERACDDVVINAGQCAADYALELMSVTARLPRLSWSQEVALAFRRRARLSQRLQAILDGSRDRQPMTAARRTAIVGSLAAIVALLATPRWPAVQAEAQPAAESTAREQAAPQPTKSTQSGVEPPVEKQVAESNEAKLNQIRELIRQHSADELDAKRLDEAAVRGMLEALHDPYSQWLSGEQSREVEHQLQGRIVGIGAQLAKEDDAIIIVTPLPNSPAAKSGLKPRDRIVTVDEKVFTELVEIVQAIRGPQGTTVTLKVERGDEQVDVVVTRDAVQLAPVQGLWLDAEGQWRYWLDAEAKIAYLQISDFSQRTAVEMEVALARLHDQGVKGLVLDLRGCPGGLLDESVKVASLLIKQGTLASVRDRVAERTLKADGTAKYADLPLLVLVDDTTASAAEVLAAAIQDRQRGVVMGERTVGKGSVQGFIPLGDLGAGASLRLTTAQIHRANGQPLGSAQNLATWGVDPNDGYYIPLTAEQRAAFRETGARRDTLGALTLSESLTPEQIDRELSDTALAAAIRSLASKLSAGDFTATGRPLSEMPASLTARDALRRERDELRAKLEQIEQQLDNGR